MIKTFFIFALLQTADFVTTIVTLRLGGVEKNPLIQFFIAIGPILGLVVAKVVVLLIAAASAVWGRQRPIQCANAAFAGVVAWNLLVIARLLS